MNKIYKREMELSVVVDIERFIKGDLDNKVIKIISKELREEIRVVLDFNELNNKNDKLGELFLFEVSAMESGCASKGVERFGIIRIRFGLNDVDYPVKDILEHLMFIGGINGMISMSLHEIIPSKYKINITTPNRVGLFEGLTLIEKRVTNDLRLEQCRYYRPRTCTNYKMFTFEVHDITHEEANTRVKRANSIEEIRSVKMSSVRLRTLACKENVNVDWNIAK